MPPVLTVIRWRDIPAQVVARDGRRAAKAMLPEAFGAAIDRAAMRAGLTTDDAYVAEWTSDREPCDEDLDAAVGERARQLEAAYPHDVLEELVANMGWREPPGSSTA